MSIDFPLNFDLDLFNYLAHLRVFFRLPFCCTGATYSQLFQWVVVLRRSFSAIVSLITYCQKISREKRIGIRNAWIGCVVSTEYKFRF